MEIIDWTGVCNLGQPTDPGRQAGDIDAIDPAESDSDLVTVVVPAFNEEDHIGACVQSIQRQTWTNTEIIVVDGGSTDRTAEMVAAIAAEDPRVRLLVNERRLIPISLNRAAEAATGTWLVRVDAHAVIPDDYVAIAVRLLQTGEWGGVGGRKDGSGDGPWGDAIAAAMGSRFGVGNSYYHYGTESREVDHVPFGAYPLDVVRELGGWDPNLAVNQDFEFDHRVRESGRRIQFDPSLRVQWQSRQTIGALFRQYRRYGRGKFTVFRKHPRSAKARQVAGPVLVLALGAGLALAAAATVMPLAALLLAYVGFLTVGAATHRGTPGVTRIRIAVAFAAMHLGHGLGFWEGAFRALARRP